MELKERVDPRVDLTAERHTICTRIATSHVPDHLTQLFRILRIIGNLSAPIVTYVRTPPAPHELISPVFFSKTLRYLDDSAVGRTRARRPRTTREPTTRGRATRESTTTTRVCNTTILAQASRRIRVDNRGRIDTNSDPSKQSLLNTITEIDVVEHGIRVLSFLGEDAVVGVEKQLLRVGGVGLDGFGFGDELLVEKKLADVRDVATGQGLVLLINGRVDMGKDCMRVSGKRDNDDQAYRGYAWCVQCNDQGRMYRTAEFRSRWKTGCHGTWCC